MPRLPLDVPPGTKPPDPELLKKDPMAEFFGPGSGMKLVGDPEDHIPDEVRAVLDEYGLSNKDFKCTLHEIPPGSNIGDGNASSANSSYLKGWVRQIPSLDWVAKNYGPGYYMLAFNWRIRLTEPDESERKSKAMRQEVTFQISDKLAEEYRKSKLNDKIKSASEVGSKVQEALIEKKIEGQMISALTGGKGADDRSPADIAKEYIASTLETVKLMGIPIGMQQQKSSMDWEKMLPVLVTGITAFLGHQREVERSREESFNKLLMLMLGQNNSANSQLVEILKVQNGSGSGNQMMKEFGDMIKGAINLKELITPQQESLADKIFRMVEGVAPQILTIAASAAQAKAAANNPMVRMAKGYINSNQDFQALKENPVEKKNFIDKMDNFFGWKQTDTILTVAGDGWDRPEDCPRNGPGEPPGAGIEGGAEETIVEE